MVIYKSKAIICSLPVHNLLRLFFGTLSRVSFLNSFIKWRELALHPQPLTEEVESNGNRNKDGRDASEKRRSPLDTHSLEHLA